MTPDQRSKSQEIASLSEELLADIELRRLEGDKLLFKVLRLARLADSDALLTWIRLELYGYDFRSDDPIVRERIEETGRRAVRFNAPFGKLWAHNQDRASQLDALRATARERGTWQKPDDRDDRTRLENEIRAVDTVLRRIVALLYDSVLRVYHQKYFSAFADSIFERFRAAVDARLTEACADVLEKLPAAFDRLADGDPEATSHALTTCRRMIDAFADAVYPPGDEPVTIDGTQLQVGQEHTKNRINAFVGKHVGIKPRRQRLRHTLGHLYDRVSEGVHREVAAQEARVLVLQTYLFLGEVVALDVPETTDGPEGDTTH